MVQIRTKQQVAFDGVRVAWASDTFTHILHAQVTTKFSMDGVIPLKRSEVENKVEKAVTPKMSPIGELRKTQKKIGRIIGVMDGIRIPLGQAHA